ncbi:MAG: hypothetical protein OCC49_01675 [Fibrobacterales bacterium]
MKKIIALFILSLSLMQCVMHYLNESKARIQLFNGSPYSVSGLSIIPLDSTTAPLILLKDTIPSDSISWVATTEFTGPSFNLSLHVFDTLSPHTIDTTLIFSNRELPAESIRFLFTWDSIPQLTVR